MKIFALVCLSILITSVARAQEYEVLPHRSNAYGQIWASDGISFVQSENHSVGNRFRLGVDLRFGDESRYLVGWTLLDYINSGEHAAAVGDITREEGGPNIGYFLIPDRLWVVYTFELGGATGSRVSGSVGTYGHQLSLGYKFLPENQFGLSAELNYLYLSPVTVPVLDLSTNSGASATYPSAQVWTLALVVSFDLG